MIRGTFIDKTEAATTTLATALGRYIAEVTPRKKGAKQEGVRIRRWLTHPLAACALSKIRGADMSKFRDEWRRAGKSENTIRLEIALVSHLFEVARKDWSIEGLATPCKSITLPGNSTPRDRRFEGDEDARLFAELRKARNPSMLPMAPPGLGNRHATGRTEMLTWENVHLAKRTVVLPDTKNGTMRTVPLSSRAVSVLSTLARPIAGG
jgi:hypothetical protein